MDGIFFWWKENLSKLNVQRIDFLMGLLGNDILGPNVFKHSWFGKQKRTFAIIWKYFKSDCIQVMFYPETKDGESDVIIIFAAEKEEIDLFFKDVAEKFSLKRNSSLESRFASPHVRCYSKNEEDNIPNLFGDIKWVRECAWS